MCLLAYTYTRQVLKKIDYREMEKIKPENVGLTFSYYVSIPFLIAKLQSIKITDTQKYGVRLHYYFVNGHLT